MFVDEINEDLPFGKLWQGIFEGIWLVGKFIQNQVLCMKKSQKICCTLHFATFDSLINLHNTLLWVPEFFLGSGTQGNNSCSRLRYLPPVELVFGVFCPQFSKEGSFFCRFSLNTGSADCIHKIVSGTREFHSQEESGTPLARLWQKSFLFPSKIYQKYVKILLPRKDLVLFFELVKWPSEW